MTRDAAPRLIALLAALVPLPLLAQDEGGRTADYYGFLPVELYKLDDRITGLTLADFDGDKVDDIAVADNSRSRIDLLLSTKGPADDEGSSGYGPNKRPSDQRMRIKHLPVNKEVVSLMAGDLNGDGKMDLAFYGTPAELVVLYNEGEGRFSAPKRITTGEAVQSGSALAVGDLNRDGRADLALVTDDDVITVLQQPDGTLGRPERLPHTANKPGIMKLVDLDGDGGDDLAVLTEEDEPIHVRFSRPGGRLGPEERFKIDQPRAIAYGEMDGKPGQEVLTIEGQSGRARVYTLAEGAANDDERRGRLLYYPLPAGPAKGRSLAVGDLNGDGRADVVATDPANAQVVVFLQGEPGEGFDAGRTFPGLVGGAAARIADFDADGKAELVVLSEQERQIGRTALDGDRLPFPTTLPLAGGDPIGLEVANLDADPGPELLYVAKQKVDGKDQFSLRGLDPAEGGSFKPYAWGGEEAVKLVTADGKPALTGTPDDVRAVDANRDGHVDVLILDPYGPPLVLLGQAGGAAPTASTARPGPLAGVKATGLTIADLGKGPTLLVAQQGPFARAVTLGADGQWQVEDQFNSGRTSAQVQAAAALDSDGDGKPEVALLDRTSKTLLFLDPLDGAYKPGPTLPIGTIDFRGAHVADLDSDGKPDLLLAGADKFGAVLLGGQGRQLEGLAAYAPTRTDARLADLIAGDLNGDGRNDLAMSDTIEHFIEVNAFGRGGSIEPGLAFRVFEQKSFNRIDDLIEPREMGVGDVDGDGRTDLVLIAHDRVLIYRQDGGQPLAEADAAAAAGGEGGATPGSDGR